MNAVQSQRNPFLISGKDVAASVFVFIIYFLTAKLALAVYYGFHTSPALIWPPVGIGLAAVIFGGYRMWIPILLAQFLALATQSSAAYMVDLFIAATYALQAVAALYILQRFGFEPTLEKLRNTLILVLIAFGVTLIEPMIASFGQEYFFALPINFWFNVGRAWGAGIFSVLVITPFVATWYSSHRFSYTSWQKVEIAAALLLLTANNVFLFWTSYPQYFGIAVIFFLPAVLIWFALRLQVHWMTLGIFLTSIAGIAGSIMHSGAAALNVQLLSDEVYIGLVAAIFLVFVAVVEERRAAYHRLEMAFESTAAADQAKSEFIAILAHELRNPLAPIVSSLELLKLQPLTQESLETILNAQEHAEMIRRLLDDLLDTARLTQKKLKLQKKNVSVRRMIDQSTLSAQEDIRNRNHELRISIPVEDIVVYADPVRVKQIIINLLTNASKYTDYGGKIDLIVERKGNEVVIRIADNGIGIARDKFPYLFEPFKQIESAGRRNTGLGIGLFLTKHLAGMHGGRIEAASDGLGQGSTFSVYLPIAAQPAATTAPDIKETTAAGALRVLVVDDNKPAADALQKLLQHHGHEVETAYSGTDALEIIGSFCPDFILLDIGMPDMDGHAVVRKIRAKDLDVTVVALSGYGQESDRLQSKQAGFDYHLVKPVSVHEILALLPRAQAVVPVPVHSD